jgi:TPR repeat protein
MVAEFETADSLFSRASQIPHEVIALIRDDEDFIRQYDTDECLEILLRAALLGHPVAQYALGCHEQDKAELISHGVVFTFNSGKSAVDWFSRAMRQGHVMSAYYYAYSMFYTNQSECVRMLQELAEDGCRSAQNSLRFLGLL